MVVITAFYQALHWIDAFFAIHDFHPEAHNTIYEDGSPVAVGRNHALKKHRDLRTIYEPYYNLYLASREARYEGWSYRDEPDEVTALLEEDLETVANHIKALIAAS